MKPYPPSPFFRILQVYICFESTRSTNLNQWLIIRSSIVFCVPPTIRLRWGHGWRSLGTTAILVSWCNLLGRPVRNETVRRKDGQVGEATEKRYTPENQLPKPENDGFQVRNLLLQAVHFTVFRFHVNFQGCELHTNLSRNTTRWSDSYPLVN